MTEREKEYVCDQLCRYPYIYDEFQLERVHLERICETCMLNKSRSQLRKEYMQHYYETKIKPARSKKKKVKRNE